jgi:hypothetical protein
MVTLSDAVGTALVLQLVEVFQSVEVAPVQVRFAVKVNPPRVAVPPGVVTLTLPVVPLATTAVMVVASTTVYEVAAEPPKLTVVAPVKLVPVMVTVAPVAADVGVNEVILGAGIICRNTDTFPAN